MKFAFISRHEPTESQVTMAKKGGVDLEWVGDADAFTVDSPWVFERGPFDGVVVVHPAAAMNLHEEFVIGVFENANRAAVGEKPTFEAVRFVLWDRRNYP